MVAEVAVVVQEAVMLVKVVSELATSWLMMYCVTATGCQPPS